MYEFCLSNYFKNLSSWWIYFQNFLLAPPDRCSLVDLLKDALQEVLFQRPDNPVKFLQNYFLDLKRNEVYWYPKTLMFIPVLKKWLSISYQSPIV